MNKSASDATVGGLAEGSRAAAAPVTPQSWSDLIVRRCGLMFRHVRTAEVIGLVHDQMRLQGVPNEAAYYQLLAEQQAGSAAWDALIERLTNHETSFFRHPPSFDALRSHILPELRASRPSGARLSFWSAGCSTGQEAYSLAMLAMDDAGARGDFSVWGGDISHQAIKVARRGRYGPRAIATIPDNYRQRFLRPVEDDLGTEFEIIDPLRQRVRFMAMNLIDVGGFRPSHDVIFCHNVLIYFSPASVTRAVSWLASCLAPGGYLLLGPGEAPNDRPPGLEPVTANGVRVFQRKGARAGDVRE
jgi:chemotaxis methyl-accepting protein methylase